ncbi:hypothetical protein [uncultured Bacteroides sp.]|uniref:hypothetical protein n=1 Tax=uncultured Bacteroides sp. TaxID=162156 RepID=UPI0025CDE1DD|nr:hypothetical protein [uncultured Bacteroides sp.]
MAVQVVTSQPEMLLEDIKHLIDLGKIDTWLYDEDGDFTHGTNQWNRVAWFRPFCGSDRIIFGIIGRKGINISIEEFSIYHGRFIEMLVKHYINKVSSISVLRPSDNNFDSNKIDF